MIDLETCIMMAADTPELVKEFDRLYGTHLSTMGKRSPLEAMIDESSGRDAEAMTKFVAFVAAYIYLPLLAVETSGEAI